MKGIVDNPSVDGNGIVTLERKAEKRREVRKVRSRSA